MATRELEERDFDYVVVGTGLTESILAAALAHAGARVLHLDPNPFYGSTSATLRVDDFDDLFLDSESTEQSVITSNDALPENCDTHPVQRQNFRDFAFPHGVKRLVSADLHLIEPNARRKIHLDLSTRTLMASGPTIDVMVRTKVGHYIDFRAIEAIFVAFKKDGLRKVPCSRSDVFQNRFITKLEKRLLMRFIKASSAAITPSTIIDDDVNIGEKGDPDESSFEEYMQLSGLTDKLKTFLWHAVVLGGEKDAKNTPVSIANNSIVRFQNSLMRFGTPTPFLYPNHGAAEIAQAFCRMCAVKGGTYVLRRGVGAIVTQDKKMVGLITEAGEFLRCKAMFSSMASRMFGNISEPPDDHSSLVWRAVCVVDRSLVRGNEKRALIVVPKGALGNDGASVRMLQLDTAVGVCPEGKFVIHVHTVGGDGIESDILNVLKHYTCLYKDGSELAEADIHREWNNEEYIESDENAKVNGVGEQQESPSCEATRKPRVLWGVLYSRNMQRTPSVFESKYQGLNFLSEGGAEVDGEFCVETARVAFEKVMADSTFFQAEDEFEGKADDKQPMENEVDQVERKVVDTGVQQEVEKNSVLETGVDEADVNYKTDEV